ncbi:MAG: hypothetical protein ABI240_12835, partial [Sphingomonas sp.]
MLWASAATTVVIWGWYFLGFVSALQGPAFNVGAEIGKFLFAVVALIVVQVAAAIVLAISSPTDAQAPADDRDREFALVAYRAAFVTLSVLIAALTVVAPLTMATAPAWLGGKPMNLVPIVISNALLLSLVIAELVRSATQLLLYRRGS